MSSFFREIGEISLSSKQGKLAVELCHLIWSKSPARSWPEP
jgi:hypothetical protein